MSRREAAVEAAAEVLEELNPYESDVAKAITAALPHLEAEWAERLLSEEAVEAGTDAGRVLTDVTRRVLRAALEAIKEER